MARKKLHPVHRGVYRVGPVAGPFAREMAAVLTGGPTAVASHESAAYLYGFLPCPARPGPVHVTVAGAHTRVHQGIQIHRGTLAHHEIRERHSIPVTAPIRTILDLAGCVNDADLETAVAEACALRLITPGQLTRAIVPGRRGAARLRALLDAGPKRTRSSPERRLLAALRAAGIEEPETNFRIGRWEVDFHWPDHQLVVEVDGYAAHSSPRAFERDRRKDAELSGMGLRVQRFAASQAGATAVAWIRAALSRT